MADLDLVTGWGADRVIDHATTDLTRDDQAYGVVPGRAVLTASPVPETCGDHRIAEAEAAGR